MSPVKSKPATKKPNNKPATKPGPMPMVKGKSSLSVGFETAKKKPGKK